MVAEIQPLKYGKGNLGQLDSLVHKSDEMIYESWFIGYIKVIEFIIKYYMSKVYQFIYFNANVISILISI